MKIWGLPHHGRATKLRGHVVIAQHNDGRVHAQAWPRKRGKSRTIDAQQRVETFSIANKVYAAPDPLTENWAHSITKNTIFRPMDLKIMIAYGKAIEIWTLDGRIIRPVRIMASEIQTYLDTITTDVGAMLYRGPQGWVGLDAGPEGYILTSQGLLQAPAWEKNAGGNGIITMQPQANYLLSSSSHATKGMTWSSLLPMKLWRFVLQYQDVLNVQYSMDVWTMNGLYIDAHVRQLATWTGTGAGNAAVDVLLDTPIDVVQKKNQFFSVSARNQSNTYALGINGGGTIPVDTFPKLAPFEFGYVDKALPAIGDVVNGTAAACIANMWWA